MQVGNKNMCKKDIATGVLNINRKERSGAYELPQGVMISSERCWGYMYASQFLQYAGSLSTVECWII